MHEMMMRHRSGPDVDDLVMRMTVATSHVLSENPPMPLGRIRSAYVLVVSVLLVLLVGFDLAVGQTPAALLCGSVLLGAVGLVVGSWLLVRARDERALLSGLWIAYASLILRGTDDGFLEVSSLRILAVAENSGPPGQAEIDEVAAQMERATPARAAGLVAYLRLRAAAHDRAALRAVSRTMRDAT
jgi:hypothetical protein